MTSTKIATVAIPLNKLDRSDLNVRQTGRETGIEELAALIGACGLLNPLCVTPILKTGEPTGRFGVVAGGRRFLALRLLVSRKKLTKSALIDCSVVTAEEATEISLAENSGRLAMHPADQFDAFAKLHTEGAGIPVDQIAQRFGVSTHTVRQRLRLASLSPKLMERFRVGDFSLDQMMAFAVTADHEAQERVADLPGYLLTASTIRHRLTQDDAPASDVRARFVGIEAYEAAGGTVRRDLFTEDRGGWLSDPLLLDKLVAARLTAEADAVKAEGWGWVEVLPQAPTFLHVMPRVRSQEVPLSQEAENEIADLQSRMEAMEAAADDNGLTDEQEAEMLAMEARTNTLQTAGHAFTDEDKARSGAMVMLGISGLRIERGILQENDAENTDATAGVEPYEGGEGAKLSQIGPQAKSATMSGALLAELTAHRTAALQAEVAFRPHLALCMVLHSLLSPYGSPCTIRVVEPALRMACPEIDGTEARRRTDPEEVFADRIPSGRHLLPWLIEQTTDDLLAILAPLVARGIDGGSKDWTTEKGANDTAAEVATLAGLDMRLWWQADAESYFGRVSKPMVLDAVRESAGIDAADELAGLKKAPMVAAATRRLDGKGWLPTVLRTPRVTGDTDGGAFAQAAE